MKFYPAEKMGFFDTIQTYFLERTGKGIVLSSRDFELLIDWRERGASTAAICRGIDRAVAGLGEPPRNIWSCRRYVEPLVEEGAQRHAGSHGESVESDAGASRRSSLGASVSEEALEKIEKAGKACERESLRTVYRDAWRRVHDLLENRDEDLFGELIAIDEALMEGFFGALEREERQRIEDEIAAGLDQAPGFMTREALEQQREARRRRKLRENFGFVSILD